jgi:hypothetical protein
MTYRDDEDFRPTNAERELFELKVIGPIVLVVLLVLIAAKYFA